MYVLIDLTEDRVVSIVNFEQVNARWVYEFARWVYEWVYVLTLNVPRYQFTLKLVKVANVN